MPEQAPFGVSWQLGHIGAPQSLEMLGDHLEGFKRDFVSPSAFSDIITEPFENYGADELAFISSHLGGDDVEEVTRERIGPGFNEASGL